MRLWREYLEEEERKSRGERTLDLFSPQSEMANLVKGVAWKDISRVISNVLLQIRNDLEGIGMDLKLTAEEVPYALGFLQGQAYQLRFLQDLPEALLEDLENRDVERDKEREDGAEV